MLEPRAKLSKRLQGLIVVAALLVMGVAALLYTRSSTEQPAADTTYGTDAQSEAMPSPLVVATTDEKINSQSLGLDGSEPADFNAALEQAYSSMVGKEEIRQLPSHLLHNTPLILKRSSDAIADLLVLIAEDPARAELAADFFSHCLAQDEHVSALRAVCYLQYRRLEKAFGWSYRNFGEIKGIGEITRLVEDIDV